ncbi:ATP-binding protein [Psychrobacter sp. F1192]|uniref:DNA mismatch repair protein MutL n=1 Tax=Psychrobacter coccoides TaxID=2818440 RepID=A0ABS3NLC7_9GAMM|nr:DNA mismatch repair endonuclease MutL [Psychrobacter coccoides]MBO1530212.1 ATP-binding protein [Psychrobacter coccoides]
MPDNTSNTRIKKLSPLLINQLAAGEVVTRPAAVVKELLENAIDAGATSIEVYITQGGMAMIEVIDNGAGIHPDDMVMAITRHATSKVADVANLQGIRTLGFRGEALAATAAVSRLTLISSHNDSGVGRQLQVAGVLDDVPKLTPVVHHRGTTVTVKDLYFNVPARRGNLKSIATEFSHIETVAREVALARADVAITLFHDNKKRLSLSTNIAEGGYDSSYNHMNCLPLSRLEQATGLLLRDNALQITVDLSSLTQPLTGDIDHKGISKQAGVDGWVWPIRRGESPQEVLPKLLYVNGRLVKEPIISNQLRQLTQSADLMNMGYALYFDLPAQWLNLNVHPSKQRIKISSLNNIMAHLSHAIQTKLKTTETTKASAVSTSNKTALDDSSALHVSFTTPLSKEASTPNTIQSNQVEAPKSAYQSAASKQASAPQKDTYAEHTLNGADGHSQTALNHYVESDKHTLVDSKTLPVCLDVISDLNSGLEGLAMTRTGRADDIDTSLPWLLFDVQGQCLLISAAAWQSKLSLLFKSSVFSHTIYKKQTTLSSAICNQQLTTLSAPMSAQDLSAFVADVESLLIGNAITAIDHKRLVYLMLTSATELIDSNER